MITHQTKSARWGSAPDFIIAVLQADPAVWSIDLDDDPTTGAIYFGATAFVDDSLFILAATKGHNDGWVIASDDSAVIPVHNEVSLAAALTTLRAALNGQARVIPHHYNSGTPFYIVECQDCLIVLNSGHHYRDRGLAETLAADHNQSKHA